MTSPTPSAVRRHGRFLRGDQRSAILPTIGQLRARSASDKAARRDQILAAAAAIAAGTPFDELAMADVAARAGLAKGTVFQYFATRTTSQPPCATATSPAGTTTW